MRKLSNNTHHLSMRLRRVATAACATIGVRKQDTHKARQAMLSHMTAAPAATLEQRDARVRGPNARSLPNRRCATCAEHQRSRKYGAGRQPGKVRGCAGAHPREVSIQYKVYSRQPREVSIQYKVYSRQPREVSIQYKVYSRHPREDGRELPQVKAHTAPQQLRTKRLVVSVLLTRVAIAQRGENGRSTNCIYAQRRVTTITSAYN